MVDFGGIPRYRILNYRNESHKNFLYIANVQFVLPQNVMSEIE